MVNVLKVTVAELTFCIKRKKKLVGNLITFALQGRNLIKPIFNSSNARGGEGRGGEGGGVENWWGICTQFLPCRARGGGMLLKID